MNAAATEGHLPRCGHVPGTDQPVTGPARTETLRPGCPVLLRDDDTVQVGLRPPLARQLPRHPDVMALLSGLQTGDCAPPRSAAAVAALRVLRGAGLVVDAGAGELPPSARAQFGRAASARRVRRLDHRVGIVGDMAAPASAAVLLDDLLDDAGLVREDRAPTVVLVIAPGPVRRSLLDPLLREGTPHLVVDGHPRGHRVGPFVAPGTTACLRCVDADEAIDDPRLPLLLEQAACAVDVPPSDPLLERFALTWAVRDLARWAEGDRPSTWSATVDVGPTEAPVVTHRLRHPHCGCAWDALLRMA